MPLFKFISTKLCLALIAGVLLGFYLPFGLNLSIIVLLACMLVFAFAFMHQKRDGSPLFGVTALLTIIFLGTVLTQLSLGKNLPTHYSKYDLTKDHTLRVKIQEVLKSTSYSDRYFADVITLDGQNATGTILLNIPIDSISEVLNIDDELLFHSKLQKVHSPLNPHQFDYQDYLEKNGIYHQIRIEHEHFIVAENTSRTVFGLAHSFRERLISKLKRYDFGEEELSIIQALLLGKRTDISEETYNNYKNAGAVHILAVSGLHVGVLLLILQFLLQPLERLRNGKTLKLLVIISLLWSFAFIAGLSPSIIRAVTMFSFLAYAMHLNRPTNTFNVIALSMFFILLVKPLFLFQVGFQMSYAAVFAIVWIYPKLQRFWYPKNIIIRKGWQLISVSIAAQLGVLPISLFYFHQFPALFFISNLVVVPFLGVVLGGGILVLLLTAMDWLPQYLVILYNALIKGMNLVIQWVAQQEAFVFRAISFDEVQLILAYVIIFAVVIALQRPRFKNLAILMLGVIAFQVWTVFSVWETKKNDQLILAHQTANSILLHQNGSQLQVFSTETEDINRIVDNYAVGERIDSISYKPLKNGYTLYNKSVVVIDSAAIYPIEERPEYLLLIQSPRINLERVLDSLRPQQVLVDGSNYKSYVERWEATCKKRKLPFHYTGEKGAYYFQTD